MAKKEKPKKKDAAAAPVTTRPENYTVEVRNENYTPEPKNENYTVQ